ncbi:thioredoxin-2-like [Leucoraja erinacea]|uniref:thioredoxin-2-like n=1 Tax=Leucoraja erinaceus TaxID=7782 RepID=UPI0024590DF4|nr:thioredoxin-2-like [Leucoraja erinacea]
MTVYEILSKDELSAKLKEAGNKLVVVDFYATWCGPCKDIAPKFKAFSTTYTDVIFCKVDTDDVEELNVEYKVKALPTFIFIKDGNEVASVVGANADDVEKLIQQHRGMQQQQCSGHAPQ